MNSGLASVFGSILPVLLSAMTPVLRDLLREFLLDLYAKSKQTANPVDDVVVGCLLGILSIDTPRG